MNIYFIRHGESEGNVNHKIYYDMPDWKVPLTKKGKEQAIKAAENIDKKLSYTSYCNIIHSPYIRAIQTAKLIEKFLHDNRRWISVQTEENPLCREREWGALRDEIESVENDEEREILFDFFRRPQGGESFADVHQRATIFLDKIQNMEDVEDLIVVSHGEFIKVCLMILNKVPVEKFHNIPNIENCEIVTAGYSISLSGKYHSIHIKK